MRPKKAVGLKDVAAALGISVVSVSNALSGKGGVSEETRQNVIRKAGELGYVYTPKNTSGAENGRWISYCFRKGNGEETVQHYDDVWSLLLQAAAKEAEYTIRTIKPDDACAGVIAAGIWPEKELVRLRESFPGPVVVIENFSPHLPVDFVVRDRFHAAFEETKRLYGRADPDGKAGRPVLILRTDGVSGEDEDYLEGFLAAFSCYDGDFHADGTGSGTDHRKSPLSYDSENLPACVFPGAERFLEWVGETDKAEYPTAVLCMTSEEEGLARKKCREQGFEPGDGFLTFGRTDGERTRKAMAQEAVRVIVERNHGEPSSSTSSSSPGVHWVQEF